MSPFRCPECDHPVMAWEDDLCPSCGASIRIEKPPRKRRSLGPRERSCRLVGALVGFFATNTSEVSDLMFGSNFVLNFLFGFFGGLWIGGAIGTFLDRRKAGLDRSPDLCTPTDRRPYILGLLSAIAIAGVLAWGIMSGRPARAESEALRTEHNEFIEFANPLLTESDRIDADGRELIRLLNGGILPRTDAADQLLLLADRAQAVEEKLRRYEAVHDELRLLINPLVESVREQREFLKDFAEGVRTDSRDHFEQAKVHSEAVIAARAKFRDAREALAERHGFSEIKRP